MRKLLATAASAALATALLGAATTSPALAQCPGDDGTIPGTPDRTLPVGPFYVDDRDLQDLDDDGDAGGLWIYLESSADANKKTTLQRGGDNVIFVVLDDAGAPNEVPRVNPIPTPVDDPTRPGEKLTLLRSGVGGGSLSETAGGHDDCVQDVARNRDTIVF